MDKLRVAKYPTGCGVQTAKCMVGDWLRNQKPQTTYIDLQSSSGRLMRMGLTYIDLLSPSGRLMQTIAIRYNRIILIRDKPHPNENLTTLVTDIARKEHFRSVQVSALTMNRLRGCFVKDRLPEEPIAKAFARYLPKHAPPFPRLDHTESVINEARINNAFRFNGERTHVIVQTLETKGGETNVYTDLYNSEDEAMLDFMKIKGNYRIMEIGG